MHDGGRCGLVDPVAVQLLEAARWTTFKMGQINFIPGVSLGKLLVTLNFLRPLPGMTCLFMTRVVFSFYLVIFRLKFVRMEEDTHLEMGRKLSLCGFNNKWKI